MIVTYISYCHYLNTFSSLHNKRYSVFPTSNSMESFLSLVEDSLELELLCPEGEVNYGL